jgi:hypothetical protein
MKSAPYRGSREELPYVQDVAILQFCHVGAYKKDQDRRGRVVVEISIAGFVVVRLWFC